MADRMTQTLNDRAEARKTMTPEERQAAALEQIADSLLWIQNNMAAMSARLPVRM